jgi:hypothetical protein
MRYVGLVEPLNPEMAVEVGRRFAKAADGVVLQCVLDVHSEQGPDCAGGQLREGRDILNTFFCKNIRFLFLISIEFIQ